MIRRPIKLVIIRIKTRPIAADLIIQSIRFHGRPIKNPAGINPAGRGAPHIYKHPKQTISEGAG